MLRCGNIEVLKHCYCFRNLQQCVSVVIITDLSYHTQHFVFAFSYAIFGKHDVS